MDVIFFATLLIAWGAAWQDARTFEIPNLLTVSAALLGLSLHTYDAAWAGLWSSLSGLALGLALFLPIHILAGAGAGDVKLMGALGALLGPQDILSTFNATIFAAALLAILYSLWAWRARGAHGPWKRYGQMWHTFRTTGRLTYQPPDPGEVLGDRLPLAVPIAISVTGILLFTP